jgi:hypothetical protein
LQLQFTGRQLRPSNISGRRDKVNRINSPDDVFRM